MGRKGGALALIGTVAATQLTQAAAWGNNKSGQAGDDMFYSNSLNEWSQSNHIAMEVVGCSFADSDYSEDVGCRGDDSGDGTQYWYQMANCKRAQVAYNVYASSSGKTSCGTGDYVGTYVTQYGLSEFAYMLALYDGGASFSADDLPMCEQGDKGYYLSTGCAADGSFTIDSFSDAYCNTRQAYYSSLDSINKSMKSYKSCYTIYDASNGMSFYNSLGGALIKESTTCSSQDDSICPVNERVSLAASGRSIGTKARGIANLNVANKAKYALGTLCLIGSLFMFLGILFTNRRKRRAMMHRKMRASRARRSKSRSGTSRTSGRSGSSRSKSRSRTSGSSSRREGSSRSKSRSSSAPKVDDGVFA
ncbi:hypothetical protein ACHAWT_005133 [Skeletonema menzelii]